MIGVFFYLGLTFISIYILGYGVTLLLLPKKLEPYSLWLIPWVCIIIIIFLLIILSLMGAPVKWSAPLLSLLLLGTSGYMYFFKRRLRIDVSMKDFFIGFIILVSILFNLVPILRREGFLTTISMGNNDVGAYAIASDYLVNHSISESFVSRVNLPVSNLLHDGYRWGTPIIYSFFQVLFGLQGYQFTYLFQTILFGLMLPLVYIVFCLLYRSSMLGIIFLLIMTAFNANLLYMLYHDFLGQILFWGIELIFFVLFFAYLGTEEENQGINKFDFLIGINTSIFYFSYHEPALFIFAPLVIYLFWRVFKKERPFMYLKKLTVIASITLLTSAISIFNAIIFDFGQTFAAKKGQPIGWELFRERMPFANPFEALGFWSIHSFNPMSNIIAVVLSILAFSMIVLGIIRARQRALTISFTIIFISIIYWLAIPNANFFAYNRVVTYVLPFFIILFVIGLIESVKVVKLQILLVFILGGMVMFSAFNLNKKLRRQYLAVDKSFTSLSQIPLYKIHEPVYTESFLDSTIPYWVQSWTGYFIYNNRFTHWPTKFMKTENDNKVPDNSLVLIGKKSRWYWPQKRFLKNIIWENDYYSLGRLCSNDDCLLARTEDLSSIILGENDYENNLLLSGWSVKEVGGRWAVEKKSNLILVTKNEKYKELIFQARAIKEPQTMSIIFDGLFEKKISISEEWNIYKIFIKQKKTRGVHNILFLYSDTYSPLKLGIGQDKRDLAVNFKQIGIQ